MLKKDSNSIWPAKLDNVCRINWQCEGWKREFEARVKWSREVGTAGILRFGRKQKPSYWFTFSVNGTQWTKI